MQAPWRKFLWPFALTFGAGLAIPFLLVLLADPYGVSPVRAISPEIVVPTQRRFIVADIIRSGRYDSFIVGTSTVNSINPAQLEAAFGGRFANVAVHGATPYEQMRVLDLVLRQTPKPRTVIVGLDDVWCSQAEPARYHPQVQFPDWLFGDSRLDHFAHLLNWRAMELARRKLEIAWSPSKARVAPNGFNDDLPPDTTWSLEKAMPRLTAEVERATAGMTASPGPATSFPALTLLDSTLNRSGGTTRLVAVLMPTYLPDSAAQIAPDACKTALASIVRKHRGVALDFMRPSAWTVNARNFWDRQHFRQVIAEMLPGRMREGVDNTGPEEALYRRLD
jgi:hypothetical protein